VEDIGPILLFIVVGAAVLVGVYFAYKAAEQRRLELLSLSQELGLRLQPGYGNPDSMHSLFGCFKRGHGRQVLNTFRGELLFFGRECSCVMGDFEYKTTSGSGKNRRTTTYRFSYLLVCIPWAVPNLTIRRETVLDKIAGALGFDDINFESEQFSRRYHVKCSDKRFAYDMIHPRMMEFLLAANPPPLEFWGPWCCITTGAGMWTPAQFKGQIEFVRSFFEQWPEHLVQDLESRRSEGGMRLP
jgi:hypothetical protein